ncbi:MAG: BlaI/MecI/CopY family transcriptional regulator [Actinomycetota bacterium]
MQLRQFGELEAVVMDLLWSRDQPATVRNVHDELTSTRQIAYTTAMSTMDNLFRKGWLLREKIGLAYHYRPTMSREEHSAKLMRTVLESGGDSALILNFFLDQIGETESAELRSVIDRIRTGDNA